MKCYYPAHSAQTAASYNEAVQADDCLCSSTAQVWYLQLVFPVTTDSNCLYTALLSAG